MKQQKKYIYFRLQCKKFRMLMGISAQILQFTSRQYIQQSFAPKIMNACVVRMSFFNGKIIDAQYQT